MITAEIHARSLANFFVNMRTDTRQTHEFEIHATRQRAKAGNSSICYRKKQIDVSFNASVLLLTMNFVITLSKWYADPLGYHLVDPQLLWQWYDEIYDQ